MTQQDLSEVLGISKAAYGWYETGRNNPSLESIVRLADLYDTTTDYLLGRTDDPRSLQPRLDEATMIAASREDTTLEGLSDEARASLRDFAAFLRSKKKR